MVFEMPLGVVIIGCLNVLAYSLLLAESVVHRDSVREHYANFTHDLPILGIGNVVAYSTVCLIMSVISVSMVFGLVLKRPFLIWPWILTAFHVLGNYGYLMLSYFLDWIDTGVTDKLIQMCITPGIIFVIQTWLYVAVFRHFRLIASENDLNRADVVKRL